MFGAPDRIDQNSLRPVLTLRAHFVRPNCFAISRTNSFSSTVEHTNQKQALIGPVLNWRARQDSNL